MSASVIGFAYPGMSLAIVSVLALSGLLFGEPLPLIRQLFGRLLQERLVVRYDIQNTKVSGNHNFGDFWWFDATCPLPFGYATLDDVPISLMGWRYNGYQLRL